MITKLVEKFGDKVDFEKQEVDFDADIVKKYNINQVPTFLFFDGEELIDRHSGGISVPVFTNKVNDNFNKING